MATETKEISFSEDDVRELLPNYPKDKPINFITHFNEHVMKNLLKPYLTDGFVPLTYKITASSLQVILTSCKSSVTENERILALWYGVG